MDLKTNSNIVFRQLIQSKFLSALKFLSILLGFLTCIVIISWVKKETGYDNFWQNKERIYRVALEQYQNQELQFRMASNYRGVTDMMLAEFPEIENRVRLHRDKVTVFTPDAQIQDVNMFYTDTCIFGVFHRKIIDQESTRLFPDLNSVVISESLSKQIFGEESPIGKSLKLNEGWKFRVTAVFEDVPENSHIDFDLLMTIPSLRYYMDKFDNVKGKLDENSPFEYSDPGPYDSRSWGRFYGYSYILAKEGVNIEDLKSKTETLITPENIPSWSKSARLNLIFQPLTDIHLKSDLSEEIKINGSIFRVYLLLLIAAVVLIISVVNYINLSVIGFYDQYRNFAVRMYHGANTADLIKHAFIKEFFITMSAGLVAIFSGYFISRIFISGSVWWVYHIVISAVIFIVAVVLNLSILHWILKSNNFSKVLSKGIHLGSGGKNIRQILVTVQFVISIFLVASTIVIFSQLRYIQKKDRGFEGDSVIFSYSPMTMNQRPDIKEKLLAFRSKMKGIPGVQSFCTSSSIPGKDFLFYTENVALTGDEPDKKIYFQILNTDEAFLNAYSIKLVAGQYFTDDENYSSNEVLLNELAVKKLGFSDSADATEKMLLIDGKKYVIKGITEDFHHLSLKNKISPILIFKSLRWRYAVGYYSFKIVNDNLHTALPLIENAWSEIYPGERFIYSFLDVNYWKQYSAEQNFGNAVTLGAMLGILISCLGLLGFARYSAVKRIKEIGVRKTFGASKYSILVLLNGEVLRLLGIASVFAVPLSWMLMNRWLVNFAYRVHISAWMFAGAFLITALIAVAVTFYISWVSSVRNPGESLKYE